MTTLVEDTSNKTRAYLDQIDKLRSLGLEKENFSLPSIVVVGDQSSGKTSLLERISGFRLPQGENMVTTCPLEIQMARRPGTRVYQVSWKDQHYEINNINDLTEIVKTAQNQLTGEFAISKEVITLQIFGEDVPDITLIDLPGLIFYNEQKQKDPHAEEKILQMVKERVKNPNTIILVVTEVKDVKTIKALDIGSEVDPEFERTIVVFTKVDRTINDLKANDIISGNTKVKSFFLTRCRKAEENNLTLEQLEAAEIDLFNKNHKIRKQINSNNDCLGINNLIKHLSHRLIHLIKRELPHITNYIKLQLKDREKDLNAIECKLPSNDNERMSLLQQLLFELARRIGVSLKEGKTLYPGDIESNWIKMTLGSKANEIDYYDTTNTRNQMALFQLWRCHFETFRFQLYRLTDVQTLNGGDWTLSNLQYRLLMRRAEETIQFTRYDHFKTLVEEQYDRYAKLMIELLDDINKTVQVVCLHLVKDIFYQYNDLANQIQMLIDLWINESYATTNLQLTYVLKCGQRVYMPFEATKCSTSTNKSATLNSNIESSSNLRSSDESIYEPIQDVKTKNISTKLFKNIKKEKKVINVPKPTPVLKSLDEQIHQNDHAQMIQIDLVEYFQFANDMFSANVSQGILFHMMHGLSDKILPHICQQFHALLPYFNEDSDALEKREKLQDTISQLNESYQILCHE